MAAIHARRGEVNEATAILDELNERATTGFIEWSAIGAANAAVGHLSVARTLVARAIAEHETYWQFAKSPAWAPFRADPEGAAMLRELGY